MKVKKITFSGMFILILFISTPSQVQDWYKLVPLESNREEVEKVLGKPEIYFEESGTYRTEIGKFSVWYSAGGCHKNVKGLQWNVPAQKMTRLLVYLNKSLPLESYISNKEDFERRNFPEKSNRYLYTSPDETIVYETISPKNSNEFVYTVTLQPSKDKQHLLCKDDKNKR